MKYHVAAFDQQGRQILGNLDGQGIFRARDYKRTQWFKALPTFRTLNNCVKEYHIFNANGCEDVLITKVTNQTHVPRQAR